MSNTQEDSVKFANVQIIIKRGNEEIVYDLPQVDHVMVDTEYEDTVIRAAYPRVTVEPKIKLFTISMKPHKVDGVLYTIRKTTHAVRIEDVYES